VVELARLPELARAVLQVVLAGWLVGAEGELGTGTVGLPGSAAAVLDVQGMVVFACVAVLAPAGSEKVAAFEFSWALGEGGCWGGERERGGGGGRGGRGEG